VLVVLADAPEGRLESVTAVIEAVAIRFGDRFASTDRNYRGKHPIWHAAVRAALAQLRSDGLVRQSAAKRRSTEDGDSRRQAVTAAGRREAASVRDAVERSRPAGPSPAEENKTADPPTLLTAGVIAPPLRTGKLREDVGLPADEDAPGPVMAELNLRFRGGRDAAFARLTRLWQLVTGEPSRGPDALAEEYATGSLSMNEMKRLVSADAVPIDWSERSLHRLWPDFPVKAQVDASCVTVKADAARRAFNAFGNGIVWAVLDSGICAGHPHFAEHHTLDHDSVRDLHRAFGDGEPNPDPALALVDDSGHGTHVAGIIAGSIETWLVGGAGRSVAATQSRYNVEQPRTPLRQPRTVEDYSLLAGMAPKARLVSLRVLQGGGTDEARVARVIRALAYVRHVNGESTDSMRIHGVNLSLGYEFDPQWFACGYSPLCKEVDKLVRSGVVVVVAAGNSGYGSLAVKQDAPTRFGLSMTINDPGNARLAITVGSTHRDAPHAYGVSYFSSKGPTGDGRRKPDLVAPGERITSCAAGGNLAAVMDGPVPDDIAVYVEETGTSMAAPHVSGAIAALLSVRREFIGQPDEVKDLIVRSATPLGRSPDFEGGGLLDLMRALQSI
jgi:subtilisin family serine protease